MEKVAKFEKISYEKFKDDWINCFPGIYSENDVQRFYENVELPKRLARGTAGYYFITPRDIVIPVHKTLIVPTGVKVKMVDGWVMKCYPMTTLGMRFQFNLCDDVSIVNPAFYPRTQEGHILLRLVNNDVEGRLIRINAGEKFAQAIFVPYGITVDDEFDGDKEIVEEKEEEYVEEKNGEEE